MGADSVVILETSRGATRPRPAVRGMPKPAGVSEDSVALTFAERFGGQLLFCHSTGQWHCWDGFIWRADRTQRALDLVRSLAREMADAADAKPNAPSRRRNFVTGAEALARADQSLAVTADGWDSDPFKLGTPDGVVDLRTGRLGRADPADRITKSTGVAPADVADCPQFLTFLDQTFKGDAGVVRFNQQFLGYSLTADISEHALYFGVGSGLNGKGVLANVVQNVLGDYALSAPMDTFTASRSDKHPTELAMLRGARFVTASETEEGKAWAEARIKQLTGGDVIQARFMRQDFFSFRPAFKLMIFGNHKPVLHNVDDAARRRFNIIPFDYRPAKPDPDLGEKLAAEAPAILRWMIEGCLDWQANGLVRPASVRLATEGYFSDQDMFGQWLDDECDADPGNTHKWEPSAVLFKSWRAYAESAGETAGSSKAFAEHMRRRGFDTHKGAKGVRQIRGVCLRSRVAGGG